MATASLRSKWKIAAQVRRCKRAIGKHFCGVSFNLLSPTASECGVHHLDSQSIAPSIVIRGVDVTHAGCHINAPRRTNMELEE
jgi:hypothetical protein